MTYTICTSDGALCLTRQTEYQVWLRLQALGLSPNASADIQPMGATWFDRSRPISSGVWRGRGFHATVEVERDAPARLPSWLWLLLALALAWAMLAVCFFCH